MTDGEVGTGGLVEVEMADGGCGLGTQEVITTPTIISTLRINRNKRNRAIAPLRSYLSLRAAALSEVEG
jgi:hypothetical protein